MADKNETKKTKVTIEELRSIDYISWENEEEFQWLKGYLGAKFPIRYYKGAEKKGLRLENGDCYHASLEFYRENNNSFTSGGKEYPVSYFRGKSQTATEAAVAAAEPKTVVAETDIVEDMFDGSLWRLATKDDVGKVGHFTDSKGGGRSFRREGELVLDSNGKWGGTRFGPTTFKYAYVPVDSEPVENPAPPIDEIQGDGKINTMTGWGVTKFAERCTMATGLPINPAEKSAKPKKESKMALLAFASKTVRNAAWSLLDWSIVTPTKNTLRPVAKITQYALCYSILATVVYSGWSLYQNPSWVFEKVSELSPITIQFKGDPANETVETVESIVEARVQAAKAAANETAAQ